MFNQMDDTILDYALFNINNITSVVISDSVTSIGGFQRIILLIVEQVFPKAFLVMPRLSQNT